MVIAGCRVNHTKRILDGCFANFYLSQQSKMSTQELNNSKPIIVPRGKQSIKLTENTLAATEVCRSKDRHSTRFIMSVA